MITPVSAHNGQTYSPIDLNKVNSKQGQSVVEPISSVVSTIVDAPVLLRSNEYFWQGRNGVYYSNTFNGNGTTGGKYKFARASVRNWSRLSNTLGIVGVYYSVQDLIDYSQNGPNPDYNSNLPEAVKVWGDVGASVVSFFGLTGFALNIGWQIVTYDTNTGAQPSPPFMYPPADETFVRTPLQRTR